jgi:thiamine kinase
MNQQLTAIEALDMMPGWDAAKSQIKELKGGLTNPNRVYRVRSNGQEGVLRLDAGDAGSFGPDRSCELKILEFAAKAGIAPAILYSDPDAGILVTEYLHGRVWQESDLESNENIEALAGLLRQVHALPACCGPIDLLEIAEKYEQFLQARHGLHTFAMNCVRVIRESSTQEGVTCCHNDIVATNVIDSGKLNLIDWEYARDNDPLFDLASAIGFHNFDERRQQDFLSAYAGGADSEMKERLARQIRIFDAIQWLWLATRQLASPRSDQARRLEELQRRIR